MIGKQHVKQTVRRFIGEPYVGKRLKLKALNHALSGLDLGSPDDILDAGCEDATFTYWFADRFPRAAVTGLDIDASIVDTCNAATPSRYRSRVSFVAQAFESMESESFDLIGAFDVLEHIADDESAVASLFQLLRPGGGLLVHVPRDRWTHFDGTVEVVRDEDAWRINAGHVRMGYSPESLENLLRAAGFEVDLTECWLRRWGVAAHALYARLERLTPARLLTIPVTDFAVIADRRRPPSEGNTVFAVAHRPS